MAKILIVEDNEGLSDGYSILLSKQGYELAKAADGQEALKQAKAFQPDLIMLDLLMPKATGLDFLNIYMASDGPKAKIIVLTNLGLLQTELGLEKFGVNRYLIKSQLSPNQLLAIIKAELGEALTKA